LFHISFDAVFASWFSVAESLAVDAFCSSVLICVVPPKPAFWPLACGSNLKMPRAPPTGNWVPIQVKVVSWKLPELEFEPE
jgi:hypothetical protein